jgi:FlaG/FlaF family flagellin (archaellin)
MKSFRRSIKAVSPVIATIIIVAIAITMSIAVAYWLLGLGGSFTKFEKVEFLTAYPATGTAGNFTIFMDLKNTGSAIATINPAQILYNGKPASAYTDHEPVCNFTTNIVMNPGQTANVYIDFDVLQTPTASPWISGMTCEITLHTTGGKDYPKAIILP